MYSKLVPCICKAKEKRQVIIVTHNPNIAVACDAEQIIYCNMDKNSFSISYESGAIEDLIIKSTTIDISQGNIDLKSTHKQIVDIMEGGEEAFDKRQLIYTSWK